MWLCGDYFKEDLNSTYVEVCLLVYEKHKGGTGFVLFSQCHLLLNDPRIFLYGQFIHFAQIILRRKTEIIMITCPCYEDPFTSHFYIVKIGFT